LEFSGTLLVVSHDRAFLDNVVTSTLVLEGGGRVGEYVGGYSDWVRQRPTTTPVRAATPAVPPKSGAPLPSRAPKRRKLTFKEAGELARLPDRIDALEREREALYAAMADPAMARDGVAIVAAKARLEVLNTEITTATDRWETLEAIAGEQ
jgi:ATP-binding cassette subfamily F protein uup